MVAQRRFLPLVAVVACGLIVLIGRLFQVQVLEAPVWGREATNLVRSANVVPYHRGTIRDRNGALIASDEDRYSVELNYRDFRRGHVIGLVAHARSELEQRCVPLDEARAHVVEWGTALVSIAPAELAALARGEAVELGGVSVPASASPEAEFRSRRALDLRFYIGELLGVGVRDWARLRFKEDDPQRARPYLELFAERVRRTKASIELALLQERLRGGVDDLVRIAPMIVEPGSIVPGSARDATPFALLMSALEEQRRDGEDQSADGLFAEAAGFEPGRLSTQALERACDTRWIARLMSWDDARHLEWVRSRRAQWLARLDAMILPRLLARAAVEARQGRKHAGARLLDGLAQLYAASTDRGAARGEAPPSWTELDSLAVVSDLRALFDDPKALRSLLPERGVLALDDEELQAQAGSGEDPWSDVGRIGAALGLGAEVARPLDETAVESAADYRAAVEGGAPAAASEVAEALAQRWRRLAEPRLPAESPAALAELSRLARALEARFVGACDRALLGLCALSDEGPARGGPLPFARERIDAAVQQERSIQKDEQSRGVLLAEDPPYALVHALERDPRRFRGFAVREETRRVYASLGPELEGATRMLIGSVRKPSLKELFSQVRDQRRYDVLRYQVLRSSDEEQELADLAAKLFRSDEWTGGSGVEDYFDPELRGRFGWREVQGLAGSTQRASGQPPENGKDLVLTLDLELQTAAQRTIEHPDLPNDADADRIWFQNPVGAIALITVDGEILAAASAPSHPGEPPPGRDGERAFVRERNFTMPTFNPAGSVFKPFVAAYALDRLGFDPRQVFSCEPLADGHPGYADMHCAGTHHQSDLATALAVSCNSYFAHVGEAYTAEQLLDMAHLFGFDEPTGVRLFGTQGRSGLVEHSSLGINPRARAEIELPSGRRKFANGLTYVQVTPMQEARAIAGLATGWLPELTLVRSIGGQPVERRGRELGLSAASLEFVRRAMEQVVVGPHGTAHGKGLDPQSLGFTLAAKTGSGDYAAFRIGDTSVPSDRADADEGRLRKHTWVAGFFPADKPLAVVVVYLHDTARTSSHTAVYVAAQFLRQPCVKNWLAKRQELMAQEH